MFFISELKDRVGLRPEIETAVDDGEKLGGKEIDELRDEANTLAETDELKRIIKRMRPSWWRILCYMMAGKSQKVTAHDLGISTSTVCRLWNDLKFKKVFDLFNIKRAFTMSENFSTVQESIDTHSVVAERVLLEIMEDEEAAPAARVSSAREMLHMAGHKPKSEIDVSIDQPITITATVGEYNPENDPYHKIKKSLGLLDEEKEDEAKMEEELSRLDVEAEEETPVEEIDKVIENCRELG